MSKIEEKIRKAATQYATMQNALPGYDPAIRKAYIEGAKFALSHQWVSVEEELPKDDEDVLALAITSKNQRAGLARCYKCSNGTVKWVSDDINADYIQFWLSIPPPPEARKEGEV